MVVTSIKQQKATGRFSIFVDGAYAFSLSDASLLEQKLYIGRQLSKEEVAGYKKISADDKLYNHALRYAAMRLRSVWEVEQYLRRKQANPLLSSNIVNKLTSIGLLGDEAFAKAWVANRRLLRPTSMRKLQQELRAKHVADDVIERVLAKEESATEQDTLRTLVAKKRNLPKYRADPLKFMQYLARQGFSYSDIKQVLGEPDSEA